MDKSLLNSLGLSSSEAAVYQAVLEGGGMEPAALAKTAGLKRTTAYSVVRSLVEKGLVIEDATRRPRVVAPASPEQVLSLIEEEKKNIASREDTYRGLANELSKLAASKSYAVPSVRFIEEGKLDSFLRQQSPVWNKNLEQTNETWWGFQDHTFVEHYGGWINWYWKSVSPDVVVQLLSNRAPVEVAFGRQHAERNRRRIKYWGEADNFLSSTWIIGDYVVMINTRTRPFYLVEIHDKLMAHDQREVFRGLWEIV